MNTIRIGSMFVLRERLDELNDSIKDFSAYEIVHGYFGYEQFRNKRPFQTIVAGYCERIGINNDGNPEVVISYIAPAKHDAVKELFRMAGFRDPIYIWKK